MKRFWISCLFVISLTSLGWSQSLTGKWEIVSASIPQTYGKGWWPESITFTDFKFYLVRNYWADVMNLEGFSKPQLLMDHYTGDYHFEGTDLLLEGCAGPLQPDFENWDCAPYQQWDRTCTLRWVGKDIILSFDESPGKWVQFSFSRQSH
jgi:hypothetical protein